MKYHYVKFHADGGSACVNGLRRFLNTEIADKFAELMRNEPGHTCKDSVACFSSNEYLEEEGFLALNFTMLNRDFYQKQLEYTENEPRND